MPSLLVSELQTRDRLSVLFSFKTVLCSLPNFCNNITSIIGQEETVCEEMRSLGFVGFALGNNCVYHLDKSATSRPLLETRRFKGPRSSRAWRAPRLIGPRPLDADLNLDNVRTDGHDEWLLLLRTSVTGVLPPSVEAAPVCARAGAGTGAGGHEVIHTSVSERGFQHGSPATGEEPTGR